MADSSPEYMDGYLTAKYAVLHEFKAIENLPLTAEVLANLRLQVEEM